MGEVLFPEVKGNARYSLGPILRGEIYCSPWCGFKCTKAAFDLATEKASALSALMGDGWKPRVSESGGWHYSAFKGDATPYPSLAEIHPSKDGTYSAWINPKTNGVAQIITDYFSDPNQALGMALQEARSRALRFCAELDSVSA